MGDLRDRERPKGLSPDELGPVSKARGPVSKARNDRAHARSRLLVRDRLIGALKESRAPLVLLSAPPGFGKTTLLQQWRDCDERPFAWLSLDSADNDPVLFLTRIVEALRVVQPSFGSAAQISLHAPQADVLDTVVPLLAHDLEFVGGEVVLALDDYHRIANPICHKSVAFLLNRLPSGVTLTLSTRVDPPLSIATLRGRGELFELRAADLCFTEGEAAEFLNDKVGLGLEHGSLIVLHERTEGWPAGVYLASLSLEDADDRAELVARFGGSNRHVVDYLTEVTLSTLAPRWRKFLLETSVLETICGPLADAVTGGNKSADLLEELERANLFLVALDDRREWYRYHQLFGELLRAHLRREAPAEFPTLHLRAFEWYAEAGFTGEAIHHGVAAGAVEAAVELVAERWTPCLDSLGARTTLDWLGLLPAEAVAGDARLLLARAWASSMTNQLAEARHALQAAREIGLDGALSDGSPLEAIAAIVEACVPRGDAGAMLAAAERCRELVDQLNPARRPLARLSLGWAQYLAGNWAEAQTALEQAVASAADLEQWLHVSVGNSILAHVALALGDSEVAGVRARDAQAALETHNLIDPLASGMADVALGAVLASSAVGPAARAVDRGLVRLRAHGEPLLVAEALIVLAPVRRDSRGIEAGRSCISEAQGLIEDCADAGMLGERLEEVARSLTPAYRRIDGGSELTEREQEVLRYLAEGLPKRDIGTILFLSYNTIHSHTKSIYQKLRVSSREAAVEKARELGAL